ncbi:alpha-L-fucosidase [Leeuwenhoekiella palythoae]|uniref:alpha-L-fucosidase n=1 Tax=Leeuwenhoekiella palythoae TaxID=573501 RepID=A0A1M5ZRU8_9FLAO|nr:alpha-L-fucosidase [Leeuwenhoekiella palythoae]RXG26823.1 alpha-L-fucosidase [Leeuwenhoekiella palythoae]SHI26888.1 alpha-L-fucosidase [Leeuwenhoekiella palythoae]
MKRRNALKLGAAAAAGLYLNPMLARANFFNPEQKGPFKPNWDSLSKYQVPEWFRDAKFGMWAHWGPQCEPESGDWYARGMYQEGTWQYKSHIENYGHPSKFGFKDVIHMWKADQWNPQELVDLYKNAGAKYFMAMANHHDNMDLWDSTYQPNWNSVKMGPKKDIIAGWEQAARKAGLPFALSVHAAHAWSWYEPSQRADKNGPLAGVPYDGNLTIEDGKGTWWEGIDPQELYAQNHPLSEDSYDNGKIHSQWNWGNGVTPPSEQYCDKFYNRTIELIDKFNPDLLYFDDTALPLWPVSNVGLEIAAYMYNKSLDKKGNPQAVITGKILDEEQRKALVWDIEKGQSNEIEPLPWQTDTCIGSWHYDKGIYRDKRYKSAKQVIHSLIDVVSKNGNLMLNIPVKGDGSIDELERAIVEEIGEWMRLNGKSIYGTRPWKIFGEGPQQESAAALTAQGFNEGKGKPYSSSDFRFVTKGDRLYATVMSWPENGKVLINALRSDSPYLNKSIKKVKLVSTGKKLKFKQNAEGLEVYFPQEKPAASYANPLEIKY